MKREVKIRIVKALFKEIFKEVTPVLLKSISSPEIKKEIEKLQKHVEYKKKQERIQSEMFPNAVDAEYKVIENEHK